MFHFFDMLHVEVLPDEGGVLLAVRVSDTRVDEYHFSVDVFREMVESFQDHPSHWTGPESLWVKVDPQMRLVSLSVAAGFNKREIHRIGQSQFEAMTAQFRAQDMKG